MQSSSNIAFKEWAVVVDALGRGEQIVILRKGGIIEDKGEFTVDHEQFWLFPTLFHQQMDSVIPEARKDLTQFQARFQPEGSVQIQFFARAVKVVEYADLAQAQKLRGQHIWKDSVIENRFQYGKKNGIHLIVARVYRLPEPVTLPLLPAYGGCKSWIELDQSLSTQSLLPVLSDADFQQKADPILKHL